MRISLNMLVKKTDFFLKRTKCIVGLEIWDLSRKFHVNLYSSVDLKNQCLYTTSNNELKANAGRLASKEKKDNIPGFEISIFVTDQ